MPAGIATILGGVIAIYLTELGKAPMLDTPTAFLMVFVGILVLSFVMTLSHLIRSYHDWEYSYLPYATELEKAYHSLVHYYYTLGQGIEQATENYELSLIDRLATSHEKNAFNNDAKSEHLHNANQALTYCLILVLLCAIPYFIRINGRTQDVQKIEIIVPSTESPIQHGNP